MPYQGRGDRTIHAPRSCGRRRRPRALVAPVLLAIMALAAALPSAAATVNGPKKSRIITVDDTLVSRDVGPMLEYLEDRGAMLTIRDIVLRGRPLHFRESRDTVPNFGLTDSAYWARFTIYNPLDRDVSFDLVSVYPLMDDIMLFIPAERGGFIVKESGDIYPFKRREFDHSGFVFPIKQGPGAATYYMRFKSVNNMALDIKLYSRQELYRIDMLTVGINGVYYGMLLIMLAYNLFIYLSVRGREYLFYVFYIAGFLLTSVALDGNGARYIWPGTALFSVSSFYIFMQLFLFLAFSREFLGTRLLSPALDWAARAVMYASMAGLLVNFMLLNNLAMMIASTVCTAAAILVIFVIMIFALYRGVRPARFFAGSSSFIIIGALMFMLRAYSVLPVNLFTASALKFAVGLQILLFSFGLADKINTMKKKLELLNVNLEQEVAEHIRDKEALKRSEARFRGVVERNFDVIFMLDTAGRFTYMSPSVQATTGYRVDEFLGVSFNAFLPEEMQGITTLLLGDLLKGKEIIGFETAITKKDGTRIYAEINLAPVMKGNDVTSIQAIARDITERKMAEEALLEEKERLTITLRSIAEGVVATDIKRRIHLMNRAAEDLTGWRQEEVLGRLLNDVFILIDQKTGERREMMNAVGPGGTEGPRTGTLLIRRDKAERIVSDRAAAIRDRAGEITGYVFVVRDITEEIKFHSELLKIEKLESIGILAGGIAHDFNNILTAIMGNINLARLSAQGNDRLVEILGDAEKASARAQELTHQFLTFSKGGAPVRQIASVEEIIRDSSRFILRGSNVRCEFDFQEKLWPVIVDVGQFSQVIQNLVINADQAMPEGGDVTITTENAEIGPESGLPLRPGRYVKISVRDTGIGIPPENISKIFDPYFTTKSDGNGLGLTSSFSIIMRHEGHISVESEPGAGTIFYVYLPSSEELPRAKEKSEAPVYRGSGRILFMDDDEAVNATARKMLEHLGFEVDIAYDGETALTLFGQSLHGGARYDLVILDLTIPGGMGGRKVIEKLIALDPAVKAIVSSGYSNDMIMAQYREFGFRGVIAKPYRIDELSRVIEGVMSGT
ncbi:MAG TPA: PAS domain S-box protein [Spirochaetota bacterium]|nr:PAS domain S-box protein [Spirochaetota bacterium]HOD14280.1 PAS domain S-box protein [Spirochaetota bacterium]HPG49272.1 PAS domain S-box protein [Spirochaetota bacterium]HPN11079.1 PAS domain S-box protein [Spirochaetota bacterium]